MKTRRSTLALLAGATTLSLGAPPALAQSDDPFDLGLVILSGGLSPIAETDLQRSFTAITAQEIEDRGHATVLDALRTVPGFAASTGGLNSFRIRGADSNHALVLIDGIEVGLGSSGTFDVGNVPIGDIERIEVLRGPQSATFGANAASGVVNIVTRGAPDTPGSSGRISLELSDNGGSALGFSIANRGERGFVSLGFAQKNTGGYDISNANGDEDSSDSTALTLKGEFEVTDNLSVGVTLRNETRNVEYDSGPGVDGDGRREEDALSGEIFAVLDTFDGHLKHRLSFSGLDQEFSDAQTITFPSSNDTTNARRKWEYSATLGIDGIVSNANQTISLLVEREQERYTLDAEFPSFGSSFSADEERYTTSTALEYRGIFANGVDLQVGVRHDDPDRFETSTSWNAALGYALNENITLRASGGKGIVAPTTTEQFGAFNSGGTPFRGNEDLTPEILNGWEIGLDTTLMDGAATVSMTYFEQQITDRIGSAQTVVGGTTFNTVDNLDGVSNQRGVELVAAYRVAEAFSFDLAYTYTDATDTDGERQIRVPEHQLILGSRYETFGGKGDIWAQLTRIIGVVDTDFSTFPSQNEKLSPYTLLNVGANYSVFDNAELYGRIENLTGETIEEEVGFERDARVLSVGFRSRF